MAWNASTDPATAGYILYYGAVSHSYTSQINVGTNTVVTLSGLVAGKTYYFSVCGYDNGGLPGTPSNEASFVAPTNAAAPLGAPGSIVVTPSSGTAGTQVYIYGTNLSGASGVSFNGIAASFDLISNTVLATVVPFGVTTGPLNITTPGGTISSLFTIVSGAAPANDNFANAQLLTGTAAFAWDVTTYATKERGEPNHAGNSGGASVWYSWTAPVSGMFSLDSGGTEFDPLLAVYTGTGISQLSVVASNAGPAGNVLNFPAAAGVTYQIAVDGLNGATGKLLLRLSPILITNSVYADTFDATEGVLSGSPLAGQNGWLSSVPTLSGVAANYFPGDGQQGYLGFSSLALTTNAVLLYHPFNYEIDTNNSPAIQFSVLLQTYNPLNAFRSSFGWVFRNAREQELFDVSFNDATGLVSYTLDDGAGPRSTGSSFSTFAPSQLVITADFSHNEWGATLNGTPIITGQPVTTTHAPLSLGDIPAKAIYPGLQSGADGMIFDNYAVTAGPPLVPYIDQGPQNQTVIAGGSVVLGAIAGGAPPLSYQWYSADGIIVGATSDTLWLDNMSLEQGGSYWVVVSNAFGSVTAGARAVVLSAPTRALLASPMPMGGNGRLLNFNLVSGTSYRLQASTNLTSWSTLVSFIANGTNAVFLDSAATNFSRRFYRLASP